MRSSSFSIERLHNNISFAETFYIHGNRLSGDVHFMCKDPPLDYSMDCYGENPYIVCNCCVKCSVVNDTKCGADYEEPITMSIFAGKQDGFEWTLRDDGSEIIIAADQTSDDFYDDGGEQRGVFLCLSFPGTYTISAKADVATPQPAPLTAFPTDLQPIPAPAPASVPTLQPAVRTADPSFVSDWSFFLRFLLLVLL